MKHPLALAIPLALALALTSLSGCKKPDETTPPDETAATAGGEEPDAPPADAGPAQEPDPPEIAAARVQYLLGNDQQVVDAMQPMLDDLKAREQHRASGLSASWLALALIHDVAENGKDPAEYAISMGDKTGDKEVVQMAKTALGAYQLGLADFQGAEASLDEAVAAAPDSPNAPLALVLAGEAELNMAFGEGDKITKPEMLDAAAQRFEKAAGMLTGSEPADKALLAKVTESQGAVLRYKADNKGACAKVDQALKLYGEAGVSENVMEAAKQLRTAAGCK